MEYREITCQEHGGTFTIPVKRGRPPVKCNPENICTQMMGVRKPRGRRPVQPADTKRVARANAIAESTRQPSNNGRPARRIAAKAPSSSVPAASSAVVSNNPSIPMAHDAKRVLEPHGWKCSGKAWRDESGSLNASVLATRGEETITLLWVNGKLTDQRYALWNTDKPSMNSAPRNKLNFDPDEMPDRGLIKMLSGRKVTWWNRLGKCTETAMIPTSKVRIEHTFEGVGVDETPGDRMITFVDNNGTGFRSFRVAQLLKISN